MPRTKNAVPSYRRHKPTGQAVVSIGGKDFYLGKHGTKESKQRYARLLAEYAGSDGAATTAVADLSISELLAAFLRHAKEYYRRPDGRPTSEVASYKSAMRPLTDLYGRTPAAEFGPLKLKAVRQRMIEADWCRNVVNAAVGRIKHIFKWAVSNELVPASVFHGLQAVEGLRRGRCNARETAPIKPVPDAFVDAILPHVSRQVAAMIELQRITGMRSGEVTIMRGCDLNTAGKVWEFVPHDHKTAHHGHERRVFLGPKAQAIIKPFLKADAQAYLFSPADAEAERNDSRFGIFSPDRKTRVFPSELRARERRKAERAKRKGKRETRLRDRYDTNSYRRAISRAVEIENKRRLKEAEEQGVPKKKIQLVPNWHPHQLRHNAATALRREHGIEVARVVLGHKNAKITEIYGEVDHARAAEVMGICG